MRALIGAVALSLIGCQEYGIDLDKQVDPPAPDTDVAAPVSQPDIEVSPLLLDFGYLPKDCPADTLDLTIANVGDAPLDVSSVELRGPHGPVYATTGYSGTIAPGEQALVPFDFTPPGWEDFDEARVVVTSDDPDEPETRVDLFGAGAEDAVHEELFIQEQAASVDVLFVLDNSGSMSGEISQLSGSFQTFINSFVNLGLDFHIGIVTTDMDNPAQSGRLIGPVITNATPNPQQAFTDQTAQGSGGSGDERGFDAAEAALTPPLIDDTSEYNVDFLRPGANLAVVVVSDEDDGSDLGPNPFSNWLEGMKSDPDMVSFSGMVGPDSTSFFPTPACGLLSGASANHAPRYHDAIGATGGAWGDLCDFEVAPFLTFLSYVAAGLQFEFELQYEPTAPGMIEVYIDGQELDYSAFDGFTYNPSSNEVRLHGDAIPGPNAQILITYPFQTSCD